MRILAHVVSAILAVLMGALIFLITAQIILRYVFDNPLQWSLEVSRILFLWIVFLGAAIAVRRRQYSGMDIISRRLPTWWSERVVVLMMAVFSVMLATLGTEYVRRAEIGRLTMTGLPDVVMFVAPAVSGVLMFLFSLERLLTRANVGGGPPQARSQEMAG